ncbi:hypothetical protein HOC35_06155 [Candidatus Woesearchaeota archaeon]|jgi:hypothetical protein|nr:hypothetical protein [Candidatus Woesearchaeota archaeon]
MPTKLDYALKEIQEWRDAREYGFRSQVESGLKFSRFGAIVFPSSKERECYYDCLSGSYEARNILSKHGIDSKVEEGKDCLSLFVLHYWLRTESGLVVDPCPMFPLVEADHKTNTEIFDLDLEINVASKCYLGIGQFSIGYQEHDGVKYVSLIGPSNPYSVGQSITHLFHRFELTSTGSPLKYFVFNIADNKIRHVFESEITLGDEISKNDFGYQCIDIPNSNYTRRVQVEMNDLDSMIFEIVKQDKSLVDSFVSQFVKSRKQLPIVTKLTNSLLLRADRFLKRTLDGFFEH